MHIQKVVIENFKCFNGKFSLSLGAGANIIVGDNEAGKSTILEAIHLALSGFISGRYLKNELSQYLFNRQAEDNYISSLKTATPAAPPSISIEVFLAKDDNLAILEGNGNSAGTPSIGVKYCVEFDEAYQSEYEELIKSDTINTIPIEYYKSTWTSFARETITSRSILVKSVLIDSTNIRIQNGADSYVSRIIRDNLEDKERVQISQAHRSMKEAFMQTPSVLAINQKITTGADITDKDVRISVDLSTQNAWETSLITYLDDIPFHYIGKGEQSIIKTKLALCHKKSQEANVILLEEPENHLSYSKLNELINRLMSSLSEKQIIVSTHSSLVANKLGLDKLIFLHDSKTTSFSELSPDTQDFFRKLPGYDTLRLILCKKAVLVEGPSDELVVQKAYMDANGGKLPIQDGVDVISVGTSFLRFLEIAEKINKPVVVITDNDGNVDALNKKYDDYLGDNAKSKIKICFDGTVDTGTVVPFNYNTLEPKILKANGRHALNKVFGTAYETDEGIPKYMKGNKTACALSIFNTSETIIFPDYINSAVQDDGAK